MLQLTIRVTDTIPIDAAAIAPDRLASLNISAIEKLSLHHGNRPTPLAELFDITGGSADGRIEIVGDASRVKNLGQEMTAGQLIVRGPVGLHCGAGMHGGSIAIHGNGGDWLGAEMRGGSIRLHGHAGNQVGAGYRGSPKGMRGGTILIDGNAGHEVGSNMRRGVIAVAGTVGDMAGHAMIAGTIIAFGGIGRRCGAGMKRGSIITLNAPADIPPTFRFACDYNPTFLHIYLKQLASWGMKLPPGKRGNLFRRYSGDLLALGKGEILVALS